VIDQLQSWLEQSWDPELPLGEWWRILAESGWAQPHWPSEWFGKGLSRSEANRAVRAIRDFGAVTAPVGFGTALAGPTLIVHGTEEQKARLLPGIVDGSDAYCQLFSEPNAGSDLAGLQCRAERDGDGWVVHGQKVWTSGGQIANKGFLLARTNVDVPKHAGLSYFAIDVCQTGIEIRPLRELTGRSYFNEVFLTGARVHGDDLIGGEGNGWAVANTTLGFERALSGEAEVGATADPGPIAGNLDRPAGSFARREPDTPEGTHSHWPELVELAAAMGRNRDPLIRDGLVRLYIVDHLNRETTRRARQLEVAGRELAGAGNMAKMAQNQAVRLEQHLIFAILGAGATVHSYEEDSRPLEEVSGLPGTDRLVEAGLFAAAPPIYGGSDQIQRNVLGERTLGLPREPSADRGVPFKDLLKN
jgi:alkylation response protein AidB-like acyl-CoA dehydrogenase